MRDAPAGGGRSGGGREVGKTRRGEEREKEKGALVQMSEKEEGKRSAREGALAGWRQLGARSVNI